MWKNKIVANTLESPDQLLAHYANPRTHDGKQRDTMRASLDELGIIAPCTVNDRTGNMIDGHMRTEEYLTAGVKEVPVIHLDLSEEDELKAIAYFDAVGTLAGYNPEKLEDLLQQIDFVNEPLENMLTDLLDDKPKVLPDGIDDIPDVETPVSKLGDLWLLNGHRVLCGDSTDKQTVERLMDGKKADMVFTDPPYGAGFDIKNDDSSFLEVFAGFYKVMPCDDNIYICCDFRCIGDFYNEIKKRHQIYNLIVWVKNLFGQGKLYHTKHEEIIFCGDGKFDNSKSNQDENVWNADSVRNFGGSKNANEAVGHPTQKPVEICARAINNSSKTGHIVYDGFLGSGSTLIACEQTDRTCYGLELDPHYVDVICKRWQTLTGQMPILEATGEAHDFTTSDS